LEGAVVWAEIGLMSKAGIEARLFTPPERCEADLRELAVKF